MAIFGAKVARADGRPSLAGPWSASSLIERYNIGEWGSACGPRPEGRDLPGGAVTVREEGEELAIIGESRTFRTNECWEQLPGVSRTSHTATNRSWQTGCGSSQNDPRQTVLVTSVNATDTTISLDEVAQYQFRIEGQNCTASARRSRTWTIVRGPSDTAVGLSSAPAVSAAPTASPPATRATPPGVEPVPTHVPDFPLRGEPAPAPASSAAASAARAPLNRCATPGSPAQVEVRPARKILRPGERFTFRTTAVDANGCAVDPKATWVLEQTSTSVSLVPGGTVVVADDAVDGNADFSVISGGRSTRVQVEVATTARYDSLLSTAEMDAAADEPAATFSTAASLGASSATAQDTAHTRKTIFVLLIGVLALGLAALGLVLVRRAPVAPAPVAQAVEDLAVAAGGPPNARGVILKPRSAAPKRSMICPSCRSEFPAGSMFCPHDGNRLVPAGASLSFQGPTIGPPGGICPTCGRGYDPGVKTCPTHGDDLVPVAVYRATAHRAAASQERGKICPSCGGRYGGDAAFCGKDGTALVLVN